MRSLGKLPYSAMHMIFLFQMEFFLEKKSIHFCLEEEQIVGNLMKEKKNGASGKVTLS